MDECSQKTSARKLLPRSRPFRASTDWEPPQENKLQPQRASCVGLCACTRNHKNGPWWLAMVPPPQASCDLGQGRKSLSAGFWCNQSRCQEPLHTHCQPVGRQRSGFCQDSKTSRVHDVAFWHDFWKTYPADSWAGEEILIFGGEAYDGRELTFYSAGQPMGKDWRNARS